MRQTRSGLHPDEGRVPVGHPEDDADWNSEARNETSTERLDRNWASLLQELRVTQTGVQLLTGFLLILPFQERFERLTRGEITVFLAAVLFAVLATVLLVAPVGMHRILFRQHRLRTLVTAAHRCALGGLVCLGCAMACVVVLTVSLATGSEIAGAAAGGCSVVLFAAAWLMWPWWLRSR
jgi:hypothetical protein